MNICQKDDCKLNICFCQATIVLLCRFRHSAANIERKALLYSLEKKEQEKLVNLYVS